MLITTGTLVFATLDMLAEKDGKNNDDHKEPLKEPFGPVFTRLNRAPILYVVNTSGLSYEEKLVLVSLQGIVNRNTSSLYMEYGWTHWLEYLNETHGQVYKYISLNQALIQFKNQVKGLVVYNPEATRTVNVATTLSGQSDLIITAPETIPWVSALTGQNVTVDLREGKFASFGDSNSIYLEVMESLYPQLNQTIIGFMNPDRTYLRDYLITVRAVCIELNPGPIENSDDNKLYDSLIEKTPTGTTVLGWFRGETGFEENYGVQKLSEAGIALLPASWVPNLSVFAAYDVVQFPHKADESENEIPELEDKIYLTFIFSDGDNLAVMNKYYSEMWQSPIKNDFPKGWSVSPLAAEIAPPLIDYYRSLSTENDTLVCGTSGAGVFYPDFIPEDELGPLLARTRLLMDATDLETIWLVNSYTAHETEYSREVQKAYTDYLEPSGVFLDYGDVPLTKDYWISEGDHHAGTPFIRATHIWEDPENFLGKVYVARDTVKTRPFFIFAACHVWSIKLDEVKYIIDTLEATNPDSEFKVVSPTDFTKLIQTAEVSKAEARLNELDEWPHWILDADKSDIESELKSAKSALNEGDFDSAAAHASRANDMISDIKVNALTVITISTIIIIASILSLVLYYTRKRMENKGWNVQKHPWDIKGFKIGNVVFFSELVIIFAAGCATFLAFFNVLYAYFWDWPAFIIITAVAYGFVYLVKSERYNVISLRTRQLTGAVLIIISGMLVYVHTYFIPLTFLGFMMVLEALPTVRKGGTAVLIAPLVIAMILAGLLISQPLALIVFGFWALCLSAALTPDEYQFEYTKPKKDMKNKVGPIDAPTPPTLFLVMALMVFYIPSSRYLSLKIGGLSEFLLNLSIIIPIAALFVTISLTPFLRVVLESSKPMRGPPGAALRGSLTGLAAAAYGTIFFISDPLAISLLILLGQICILSLAFITMPKNWNEKFTNTLTRDFVVLFLVVNLLFILPVLAYTLYITELGVALNYLLYTFPLLFALGLCIMIIPVAIYWREE
jgi:hypothetical protein